MRKQTLKFGILLTTLIIITSSCKQKEKYTPATENENPEAITPINSKLPADVLPSCMINQADFNHWFKTGQVTINGVVNPANSVTFEHENNCNFYKWSEQMFLWTTSPFNEKTYNDEAIIQNRKIVIESPEFYTVTPKVNGSRTLIPHETGKLLRATTSLQKRDSRIDTEEGQATGDALMSQHGALLYYITFVNDVYAQFLTGASDNAFPDNEFPTTQPQLDAIKAYTLRNNISLKSPNTLAMEIKTSWVEVNPLSDFSNHVTIEAEVPTYNKTSNTLWTPTGKHIPKKLAMIGMHVVGSAAGHPEMIWATFEHKNNAPNLSYQYLNNQHQKITVNADTGNNWLLNNNSASTTYNQSHMKYNNDNIKATPNHTISGSNTKMVNAFGVAYTGTPNPENNTPAASNSQVISINNSVLGKLIDGDIRKNYVFIGATWTNDGVAPTGKSYSEDKTDGSAIGTSQLANSTMETYAQYGTSPFPGNNASCFACHNNYPSKTSTGLEPSDLSHIYQYIKPLTEE
ncbi:MAG: hypothetical protein COA88_01915 [Kordia sp.]|nr:MAG: hypothetical protein COA88_01915 [Kordia sp.]